MYNVFFPGRQTPLLRHARIRKSKSRVARSSTGRGNDLRDELDVVQEHNIQVVRPQALQTAVDARADGCGRVVELSAREAVPPALRRLRHPSAEHPQRYVRAYDLVR